MQGAGGILEQVLPVYLLILAGGAARRLGVTKRDSDDGILHLVFHVMYPCFIIDKILGSTSVKDPVTVAWSFGFGFVLPVVGMAVAWLVAGWLGFQKGNGRRTFAVSAGVQNFGYTAIPVVQQLWAGAGTMAILFVHNIGVEMAIWSVGVMLISGDRRVRWRRMINGPVVAVVVGLILVAIDWDGMKTPAAGGEALPGVLRTTMRWLGAGAFPAAIFVTGAVIVDLIGKERPTWKTSIGGSLLRLAVIPAVMLAVAGFLPAPQELKQVMVVQAAMPAAMTPILLAKLYGGRPGVAVEIIVTTTVLSLFTLPVVLYLGRMLLGV